MRVLTTIPHPHMTISVFGMNDKYILKLEAGPMEQAYKIPMNQLNGTEGVEKLLDNTFVQQILERFNAMYLDFKAAQERLKTT